MAQLTIKRDYLDFLLLKLRSIKGRAGVSITEPGSNPIDDKAGTTLEDRDDHLDDNEVARELDGLNDRQRAEIIALIWIGRGDFEPEEWNGVVDRAMNEFDMPVTRFVLGEPLVAEHIAMGLVRLDEAQG